VAEAGIAIVSLPMCNLFLQDRTPGRTPRWRGVALLHEIRARGIRVAIASDNCRDPFYGYGDHDMLEVFREAVRIAHLDRLIADAGRLRNKSRDYYWYSPILRERLDGVRADLAVMPDDERGVVRALAACYARDIPVTVRGSGTGNYGQAMPLRGGVVLDLSS